MLVMAMIIADLSDQNCLLLVTLLTVTFLQSIPYIEARETKACHSLVKILQTPSRDLQSHALDPESLSKYLSFFSSLKMPQGFLFHTKSQLQDLCTCFRVSGVLIRFCLAVYNIKE